MMPCLNFVNRKRLIKFRCLALSKNNCEEALSAILRTRRYNLSKTSSGDKASFFTFTLCTTCLTLDTLDRSWVR